MNKVIFFEGVDRSGKSTIKELFDKLSGYEWMTFDRGLASYIAYGDMMNREINHSNVFTPENTIIIYVTADPEVIKERMIKTEHQFFNVEYHIEKFDTVMRTLRTLGFSGCEYKNNAKINDNDMKELVELVSQIQSGERE